MPRTAVEDPLTVFRYRAIVDGFVRFGFTKITGMKKTTDIMEIREGGWNESPRKSPGLSKYDNITFVRGQIVSNGAVGGDDDFQIWLTQVHASNTYGTALNIRKSIEIQQYANTGGLAVRWAVDNALPASEIPFGDLDGSTSEHAFETIEVAHEGYRKLAI